MKNNVWGWFIDNRVRDRLHVFTVFCVVILVVAGAVAVQRWLRPQGYGVIGNYRVGALSEIMEREPIHQGNRVCGECHKEILDVHDKDIHYDVKCEDCHGPGNIHVAFHQGEVSTISDESAMMPREYTFERCLFCHRRLAARPRNFAQIDRREHYDFLHVERQATRCIECHNPHEPIFLLTKVAEARIHPVIYECNDCHDTKPELDHSEVAEHPVIFVCRDCHPAVVDDFEQHEHSFMECTACHLFHRESDTAGRIFKDGNRRFCLLCHEKKPFKNEDELPQVVPVEHITENAADWDMDSDALLENPRACLECHFDAIHDSELIGKGGTFGAE